MSNPYETAKQKKHSVLGPTLRFKGELSADEDLLIQGAVEGSIKHTSSLTIGEEGQVHANISAEYIAVEGKVKGDLAGSQSVVIRDSADIDGNIFSPVVTLLEGAKFNGSIDMSGKMSADKVEDKPPQHATDAKAPSQEKPSQDKDESRSAKSTESHSNSSAAGKKKSQRPEKKSASAA